MSFDWRDKIEDFRFRYPEEAKGFTAWLNFADKISDQAVPDRLERPNNPLVEFLDEIDSNLSADSEASYERETVFISHQRKDILYAERIAFLACSCGIDYWLDVHDPVLCVANNSLLKTDPRYPVIIAAIIEMALLNCSYIVAVHTDNSLRSRWVPYEFGRARDRNIRSVNCGSWFHKQTTPKDHGDYLELSRTTLGGEPDVTGWLSNWSSGPPKAWQGGPTQPLP